ncbi:unnamed protein product [Acanthoscelides obtectus]|uniref:Uncharacterized protein n=1 Tax=Acanthoscelides obtectus TaxID=200917 RepID=A0A9P0P7P7_ACAOB|nr:unnamed protein product [Acanthoscelides obtectus]CAK1640966.1 hypothetical protein AOBTE_LOCUS12046 [Acanthoscelides obtectus]
MFRLFTSIRVKFQTSTAKDFTSKLLRWRSAIVENVDTKHAGGLLDH